LTGPTSIEVYCTVLTSPDSGYGVMTTFQRVQWDYTVSIVTLHGTRTRGSWSISSVM